MTFDDLLGHLDGVRRHGDKAECRCPAHEDKRQSLSVGRGDEGGLVVCCHAGCAVGDVMTAMGLTLADLAPNGNGFHAAPAQPRRVVATYDYRAADGTLAYQVVRYHPKDFRQRRPTVDGGWTWSVSASDRLLYRLPELLAAPAAETVWFVEGEKDADALVGAGLVATTTTGGASGKWDDRWTPALRGRHVVIFPDNDAPGRRHAEAVRAALEGTAASVRVLEAPGLPDHGDVTDYLTGHSIDELRALATLPIATLRVDSAEEAAKSASEPVQWCVEPLTTTRAITIMSGMGGARKSMMSMVMGLLAIKGGTLGELSSSGGHTVLWIDAENPAPSWWRKMFAVAAAMQIDLQPLIGSRVLRAGCRRYYLDDPAILRLTLDTITKFQPTLVVIDSLTAVHQLDEIKAGPMRHLFDGSINDIREGGVCSVLVLHHERKPDQAGQDDPTHAMRGSSDLRNVADCHISFSRSPTDPDLHTIRVTKNREAPEPSPINIRFTLAPGQPLELSTERPPKPAGRTPSRRLAAQEIIDTLDSPTFPSVVAACLAAGISRPTAVRAWKEWSE